MLGLTWPRIFCKHPRVRCTHGDEIIARGFKRRVCLDCNRALDGPLPEPCTVTGRFHAYTNDPLRMDPTP